MKATIGTATLEPSRVIAPPLPHLTVNEPVLADQGVIADGQIVAKDANGMTIPHKLTEGAAMTGTIDGTNKNFTATLGPTLPGSVKITNNNTVAQELVDDGLGHLIGGGSGTIVYKNGAVAAALTTAPAVGKTVVIDHKTKPTGVNIGECDTAEDDSAVVMKHGTVNRDLLLTGAVAADAEDIAALEAISVYAV